VGNPHVSVDGAVAPREREMGVEASAAARQGARVADDGPPTALLAIATPATRTSTTTWLERAGLRTAFAANGPEVVELFQTLDPSIVVVDFSALDVDDCLVCTTLRRLPGGRDVPVVALCANNREVTLALEAGATDIVQPPISWPVVARRLKHLAVTARALRKFAETQSALEQVKDLADKARLRMQRLATTDHLTALPNRAAFDELLGHALARGRLSTGKVAVLYLNLDRFKDINAAMGRRGGNEVLRQVAERLRSCVERTDLVPWHQSGPRSAAVARLSGDEFTLMVTNVADREGTTRVASILLAALSEAFVVDSREVFVSPSIGIAISPANGEDEDTLVLHAEEAMYEAKRHGGGDYKFFDEVSGSAAKRKLKIDRSLRRSFEAGELEVYFQPVVALPTKAVVAAEALLRWFHPELGEVEPAEFVPIAEESGLMVPIGAWVLRDACRQLRQWLDAGLPRIRMSVNVSLCQLERGNFPAIVADVLAESDIDPALLELELSDRGVFRGDPDLRHKIEALAALGVRISVDDFGTGQSALAYLRRFPVNLLKIDKSYIAGITSNQDDAAITSAIIAMAHCLQLEVIAEGVETEEQRAFLSAHSCEEIQGYLIAGPMPERGFRDLLAGESRAAERLS